MNQRNILLALLLGLPFLAFAQETALDKITEATCGCMSGKDLTQMEKAQFEQELGMCMFTAASPLMEQLQKEEGIDISNPDNFQKVGEKVGQKLATGCPTLFAKMLELYSEEVEMPADSQVRQIYLAEGTFVAVQDGPMAIFQIKTADGNVTPFLWLQAFEGSEAFQTNSGAMTGKSLKVFYEEQSLYQAKTGTYQKFNVVQKVEIN
ncbi:MAG: hypothetical protein Sapg2KO_30700 [Saprospiraceae bacterium]